MFSAWKTGTPLKKATNVNSIYKDARGYLWLGGWGSGLDRFDERTGQFKHYRHNPDDPNSLPSNHVLRIYGDRKGQLWVGHIDGVARLDPATEQFTFYRPDPKNPTKYGNAALAFYQDRSGTLWVARGEGVLSRYDDKTKTFANYTPDSRGPHGLNGGDISAIHEDRTGTLVAGSLGWTVPVQPSRRNLHPLHGKSGPTQQRYSGDSGRQGWQTLAQHEERHIALRSSDGNV